MKKILTLAGVVLAAVVVSPVRAADPVVPFPGPHVGKVFLAAQTVTTDGAMSNFFAPGSTVVFRAYAVDGKTHKLLGKRAVQYFYVTVPGQPKVKLAYTPKAKTATGRFAWTGSWTVPSDYSLGIVKFRMLIKTHAKRTGAFTQMPVASSQLTITKTPQLPPGAPPNPTTDQAASTDVGLYADTVNGTRPAGTTPRPVGCTQTNVFKRGEQLVVRTWGFDLATGGVLSNENVQEAHFSVAGISDITLNWGAHGATGAKVYFWTNQWQIPTTYPLGDVVIQIQFTTINGKVGKLAYPITIIP
jgi:hypothetical protein